MRLRGTESMDCVGCIALPFEVTGSSKAVTQSTSLNRGVRARSKVLCMIIFEWRDLRILIRTEKISELLGSLVAF